MSDGKEGAASTTGAVSDPDRVIQAGAEALEEEIGLYLGSEERITRRVLRAMLEEAGLNLRGSHDTSKPDDVDAVLTRSITLRGQIALLDAAFPEKGTMHGQFRLDVEAGP